MVRSRVRRGGEGGKAADLCIPLVQPALCLLYTVRWLSAVDCACKPAFLLILLQLVRLLTSVQGEERTR